MAKSDSLVVFERGAQMLVEATTIQKAKEFKDLALTAADWAKRKGMGDDVILTATRYARLAEIRLGELLAATDRAKGARGNPGGRGAKIVPCPEGRAQSDAPTLESLGVSWKESSRAKRLAQAPSAVQTDYVESKIQVAKALSFVRKAQRKQTLKEAVWPTGKFRVIYADPAWTYSDKRGPGSESGGASEHYETETTDGISARPVKAMATKDSVLFLWATVPLLPDALRVMDAWGFTYKTHFVWDKQVGFNGHYSDVRHELLLLGVRGSCTPEIDTLFPSVIAERKGKHSAKPETFRKMIDSMYPTGPRIELYARQEAKGWQSWGNESA
jgi:N6-adenosine-specific RNA methylase IME4